MTTRVREPSRATYCCTAYPGDYPKEALGPHDFKISNPTLPPHFRREFGPPDQPNPLGYREYRLQHYHPCH